MKTSQKIAFLVFFVAGIFVSLLFQYFARENIKLTLDIWLNSSGVIDERLKFAIWQAIYDSFVNTFMLTTLLFQIVFFTLLIGILSLVRQIAYLNKEIEVLKNR